MSVPWKRDSAVKGTGTFHSPIAVGPQYLTTTAWKGPSSYTTGGDTIYARDLNLGSVFFIRIFCISADLVAHPVFATDEPVTSFKVLLTNLAGTEVTNTTDESAKKFIIEARGVQ